MPFFSNLLPEERLRDYLAGLAGVNPAREFFLLWALGPDLPGAVTIKPADGEEWPPDAGDDPDNPGDQSRGEKVLRFSLAGVQLKFSAVSNATGGLTIPAKGVGGSWIVKLPSEKYDGVPENEYSMLTIARQIGMNVPAIELVSIDAIGNLPEEMSSMTGQALAIERFDRLGDSSAVHIEDFAQIFGLYPEKKYDKASAVNIAGVIAAESDENDVAEFVRRLTFNALIGNADMHVKNWSVYYPDRITARLAPAYDFVSTIPYIKDDEAALKFSRTKRFDEFNEDELAHLANRARLPKALVLDTARETVELFHQQWNAEKNNLPLFPGVITKIDEHVAKLPLF
jgi:serine/threonine-protein kinase HipA